MDREVIVNNVCRLITPFLGVCWVCNSSDILVAHDITVDKSICIECVNDALNVDTCMQLHFGSEVHHRDKRQKKGLSWGNGTREAMPEVWP